MIPADTATTPGCWIMTGLIYAIATMDTKGHELAFVAERLRAAGVPVVTVDVGTLADPLVAADVGRSEVAAFHPEPASKLNDRGQAVAAMSRALQRYLLAEYQAGRV